jgi:REP element-mobilizing transposase RayT
MRPAALTAACPATFRVVHVSVQTDHVHMIVEVASGAALRRGLQVFARRAARALNRAWGRSGDVWGDRCQARAVETPREVRNGLLPVLLNLRKHVRAARSIRPAA